MTSLPVTVVVPVRNEERNLPECLKRLGSFTEVIVVDSGSTDRTAAIAQDWGARVIQFVWDGRYPKKRNFVLMNEKLRGPWVLFLDADEYVTDAFLRELSQTLQHTVHAGFWLNYTNYFMGKELKHGVQQKKLALFRVGKGLYERIEERAWSGLDMEVHEHPVIEGSIGEIAARIDHRDNQGIEKFLTRHVDYAKWEASRLQLLNADGCETPLTPRQRFKYKYIGRWWYPFFYFALTYVLKLGWLDGGPGLAYAFYKAWYFATVRLLFLQRRPVN